MMFSLPWYHLADLITTVKFYDCTYNSWSKVLLVWDK